MSDSLLPTQDSVYLKDTIVALSSARGTAGVSLLRVSGCDSHRIISGFVRAPKSRQNNQFYLRSFVAPDVGLVDNLMVVYFEGPRSYTGENVVELHCHGSTFIVDTIIQCLLAAGCRHAEPGEFTRRAFLNGKLDLTQAEGIKELIDAQTRQQWIAARYLASGRLSKLMNTLHEKIVGAMAFLEALIDFPEEDDTRSLHLDRVEGLVDEVRSYVLKLLGSYENGRICQDGLRVAIIGQPNMGKSTLMNHLLGQDRAIVTDVAGTTRDYIEEKCLLSGRLIRLIDTAGITETTDKVEQIGVTASRKIIETADLILAVVAKNVNGGAFTLDEEFKGVDSKKILRVVTKSDLVLGSSLKGCIEVSCFEGTGIDTLRDQIVERVDSAVGELTNEQFVTSPRHKQSLESALVGITKFKEAVVSHEYEECLAFELQNVARSLSEVIGHVDHEELLDKIFSSFCIGK